MKKNRKSIKITASLAMLSALSIILGKYMQIPVGDFLRFSFENLPILFSGIFFGPIAGALVGITADLIGCVMVGYAINPILTVAATIIGLISGAIYKFSSPLPLFARISASVIPSHIFGSVILKSIGLSIFYSLPLAATILWRILNYIIVGACEVVILYILSKNRAVTSAVAEIRGKRS